VILKVLIYNLPDNYETSLSLSIIILSLSVLVNIISLKNSIFNSTKKDNKEELLVKKTNHTKIFNFNIFDWMINKCFYKNKKNETFFYPIGHYGGTYKLIDNEQITRLKSFMKLCIKVSLISIVISTLITSQNISFILYLGTIIIYFSLIYIYIKNKELKRFHI
jgi:hypothetical protein